MRVLGLLRAGLEEVDPGAFDLEPPRREPQRFEKCRRRGDDELLELAEAGVGQTRASRLVIRRRDGLLGRGLDVALGAFDFEIRSTLAWMTSRTAASMSSTSSGTEKKG